MIVILLIALEIYALIQMTTWTLSSFRFGIVVISFSTSFSNGATKKLINRMVETKGIMFKFVTQDVGLFRNSLMPLYNSFAPLRNGRIGFPLLGEIKLTEKGVAQIKIRIPFSSILVMIALFVGLVEFATQGIYTIDSIAQGFAKASVLMAILGVFGLFGFLIEKDIILHRIEEMKKYLEQQNRNSTAKSSE